MKTAFHKHLALGGVNQLDTLGGCLIAVHGVNDLEARDVDPVFDSCVPDLRFGSD